MEAVMAAMMMMGTESMNATRTKALTPVHSVKRAEAVRKVCAGMRGHAKSKPHTQSKMKCHSDKCSANTIV